MAGMGLRWRDQLPPVVVDEFENLIRQIRAQLSVTQNDDGSISDAVMDEIVLRVLARLQLTPSATAGPPGLAGVDGDDGSPGPPGRDGTSGTQGLPGQTGPPGAEGAEGDIGMWGPPGPIGPSGGPVGPVGPQGVPGDIGPIGSRGFDGDDGDPAWPIVGPAGAAGSGSSGLTLIQEQLLGADVASVTFSAIPGSYRHLRCIIYGKITEAVTDDYVYAQFNGDTGANYDHQQGFAIQSALSAANTFAQTKMRLGELAGASSSSAAQPGFLDVMIPHYAGTTFNKLAKSESGFTIGTSGNGTAASFWMGHWRSTAAITSIVWLPAANNFKAGTIFSLYGIQ